MHSRFSHGQWNLAVQCIAVLDGLCSLASYRLKYLMHFIAQTDILVVLLQFNVNLSMVNFSSSIEGESCRPKVVLIGSNDKVNSNFFSKFIKIVIPYALMYLYSLM